MVCDSSGWLLLSIINIALCVPTAVGWYDTTTCASAAVLLLVDRLKQSLFAPVISSVTGVVRLAWRMVSGVMLAVVFMAADTLFSAVGVTVRRGSVVALATRRKLQSSSSTTDFFVTPTRKLNRDAPSGTVVRTVFSLHTSAVKGCVRSATESCFNSPSLLCSQ